jgi:hypothetical protein
MTPLSIADAKLCLINVAPRYEEEMNDEIKLQTNIIDPLITVKTNKIVLSNSLKLISTYQVYQHFMEIQKEVLAKLLEKSKGNPLLLMSIAYQFII